MFSYVSYYYPLSYQRRASYNFLAQIKTKTEMSHLWLKTERVDIWEIENVKISKIPCHLLENGNNHALKNGNNHVLNNGNNHTI